MSEAEKKFRERYRRNRSRWITNFIAIIATVTLLLIICVITYSYINKAYYAKYTESSDVDYKVQLLENEFYEDEYLDQNQTYVASLVDNVIANFKYDLITDAEDVFYEYSYKTTAQLLVVDKTSKEPIFNPVYELAQAERTPQSTNDALRINELVVLDYEKYNSLAEKFILTYDLKDVTCNLTVRLAIKIYSVSPSLGTSTVNDHVIELDIPLTNKTVDIKMTSSVPISDSKTIAVSGGEGKEVFKVAAIAFGIVDVILVLILIAFIGLTKTQDITYTGKIKKILSQYKSHIQTLNAPFDPEGYQVLTVKSFEELLEIRDTIQKPILMYENEDKTATEFYIPTDTSLAYKYEVKIDGIDNIYKQAMKKAKEMEESNDEPKSEPTNEFEAFFDDSDRETVIEEPVFVAGDAEIYEFHAEEDPEPILEDMSETVVEFAEEIVETVDVVCEEPALEESVESDEEAIEEIIEEAAEEAVESVLEEAVEEIAEEPFAEAIEESSEVEEIEEAIEEIIEESAEEAVEEIIEESAEEAVEESSEEAPEAVVEETAEEVVEESIEEAPEAEEVIEPAPVEEISELDEDDEDENIEVAEELESEPQPEIENGVEVISVVWPEHRDTDKLYRYDPNGEKLERGDVVLVPSKNHHTNKDFEREAEVAIGNHFVDPETIKHPLKKIIRVVRRKAEDVFTSMIVSAPDEKGKKQD